MTYVVIVILLALWIEWRLRGNRKAEKDLGSDAGKHSVPDPPAVTHYHADTWGTEPDDPVAAAPSPRVGVIPAWRSWRLDASLDESVPPVLQIRLVSTSKVELWDGPVKEADEIPTFQNSNGIYAAKRWNAGIIPGTYNSGDARVFGRVGLYGVVVEADEGYRAQKVVMEELWLVDETLRVSAFAKNELTITPKAVRDTLAARYQVDVHIGWPDGDRRKGSSSQWNW